MSKTIVCVSALTAVLVTGLGMGVSAHLAGYKYVDGSVVHTSSYDATIDIKVKNPDKFPSALFVQSLWTLVDTECENPAGNTVYGQAALQVLSTSDPEPITSEDVSATENGKATISIHVETDPDDLIGVDPNSLCVNPNWTLVDFLVREMVVTFETQECATSACLGPPGGGPFIHYEYSLTGSPDHNTSTTAAYVEIQACVLPASVHMGDTFPPGQGVPYDCDVIREEHLY